jgi:hypothetical protein
MSDVILFRPKAELDAEANLAGFVKSCRNGLSVFGADLDFDANVWDVTKALKRKGMGKKRERLVFSNLLTATGNSTTWMAGQFLLFAKAYIRYMQGLRPTKAVGFRLAALRVLDAALSENELMADPVRVDAFILNRAAQMVVDRYGEAAAYRIGGQLEMIAEFLAENHLTIVPTRWRNPIKRPGDAVRIGEEFDKRRQQKMPTEGALDALPKVFRLAAEPEDVLFASVAATLCAAPDRINEVLILPEQCEVSQKARSDAEKSYGLRWWPSKGAEPMVKWIVPSMATVVQEAIAKIRAVTDEARRIAKWYEGQPKKLYLPAELERFRDCEWLSMSDIAEIIGLASESSAVQWCGRHGVVIIGSGKTKMGRFAELEQAILAMLPQGFPYLDDEIGLKYSDALFVVRVNEMHIQRGTYRCMIEPVTINQINTGFGTRVQHGFPSVFTRLGFAEQDGSPINVTTHQFRHYLNTLAQAGGMSQLDIAKWSGRKDIRQNAVYDHVTADQMLQKIRDAIGDESEMFGPLSEIPKKVLIPRDEFARLRIPTAHSTDLGFCVHDYTMSPCQLHRDCVNCEDLVCVKGDEEKMTRLHQSLDEARTLLRKAEDAVKDGYAGSDRWVVHHQMTVERLTQLCLIMNDPAVPLGAVVQLAPPRMAGSVSDASRNALPAVEEKRVPTGLLADDMA